MTDWLEKEKDEQQRLLDGQVLRERQEAIQKETSLSNYLKNKSAIDSKIAEIEQYFNEVKNVITDKDLSLERKDGDLTVKESYTDGNRKIHFSFQNNQVFIIFSKYWRDEGTKDGKIQLDINKVTVRRISPWFQWITQRGGEIPVELKTADQRETSKKDTRMVIGCLLIICLIVLIVFALLKFGVIR